MRPFQQRRSLGNSLKLRRLLPPEGKDWCDVLEDFDERSAIVEFDGGLDRDESKIAHGTGRDPMTDQISRDEIQTERLALNSLDGKLADDLDWRDPEIEPLDRPAEGQGVQLQTTILRKQLM